MLCRRFFIWIRNICLMYNYRVYNNLFWIFHIQIYKLVLVCSTLVFIHFGYIYISGCTKLSSKPKKNLIEQSSIDAKCPTLDITIKHWCKVPQVRYHDQEFKICETRHQSLRAIKIIKTNILDLTFLDISDCEIFCKIFNWSVRHS